MNHIRQEPDCSEIAPACPHCTFGLLFLSVDRTWILLTTRPTGFSYRLGARGVYPTTRRGFLYRVLRVNLHSYISPTAITDEGTYSQVREQIIAQTGCFHLCPCTSHTLPRLLDGEFCSNPDHGQSISL